MKLLLVNHYAGSSRHGMEFRPYYLAREWVRAGHAVQIVAASYSHVRTSQPELRGAKHLDETMDGIAYRWYATPRYAGNGLGRVRNIAAFLAALWRDTPRLVREFAPDVVIASSTYPMDIWVARRIARRAKAKLVHEIHDLWPASPIELAGMSPRHPFIRLCQRAEDAACRDADVVVSMLPKVAEHLAAHGLDLRKLHIVPNGIAVDEWSGTPPALAPALADHLDALHRAGRCVVGYAGSHGLPNALDVLLDAAALLRSTPIAFVLVGDGHEKARLAQRVRDEALVDVSLFDPIAKAQIPDLLARFDIAYIGWQQVSIYRFGIAPNKLVDYMMAARAVLHSVEAGNDPVGEAGCGLTVAPESAMAVVQGLRRLAALTPEERAALGERGRRFVLAHHTYTVLAQRFIEAVS
ncbi:MAG: glycosyltransferase family 4 protein [Burkholderiaceae bacterium]